MEIKINSYSSQSSLFSSLICFILGGIFYTNAEIVLGFTAVTIGIILSIVGIFSLVTFYINYKKGNLLKTNLFIGILTIILAIVFLTFNNLVEILLGLIVGGGILLVGILRLAGAMKLKFKSRRFIINIIISLLLIGLGVYTIASGSLLLEGAGILMMISSGIEIIGYLLNNKLDDKKEDVVVKKTEVILELPEKEVVKEEKVKVEPKLIPEDITEKHPQRRRGRKKKVKDVTATETKETKTTTKKKNTKTQKKDK